MGCFFYPGFRGFLCAWVPVYAHRSHLISPKPVAADGKFVKFPEYTFNPLEESSEKERAENLRSYTEVARTLIDLGATSEHVFNWIKSFADFHLDKVEFDADAMADYDDLPDDDPWGGGGMTTNNADFDESKVNRDNGGQFAKKPGGGASGDKDVDTKSRRDTVLSVKVRPGLRLSATEYGKVTHELNNNLTPEEREKDVLHRAIGNHVYTIQNNGFNEYTVLRKVKL